MLGDTIAVLDGLNDIPDSYSTQNVLDPSAGANYSGGSSWTGGMPLTPSNAGLAGAFDIEAMARAMPVDFPVPLKSQVLQQYLAAAGAKIGTDGIWGSGSNKALVDFVKANSKDSSEAAALAGNITKVIAPFAKGRMVLLQKPKLLFGILQVMSDRANSGKALDGIPSYYSTENVLDASAGGNYSGGSSHAPGLPLLPSNAGLADMDLVNYYTTQNVLDPSAGANYSGGSSWTGGMPLTPSNAGLAGCAGCYDGVAMGDIDKMYGSTMELENIPSHYSTKNVIDASGGANYSGGSSHAPGLPLLPSNAGLAGLSELNKVDPLDKVKDKSFTVRLHGNQRAAFQRLAGQDRLAHLRKMAFKILSNPQITPLQRQQLVRINNAMRGVRGMRVKVARTGTAVRQAA